MKRTLITLTLFLAVLGLFYAPIAVAAVAGAWVVEDLVRNTKPALAVGE